jgi:putative sigma-54 modulation protein
MHRLSRHFDHVISINVIMKVEKLDQRAEATVNAGGRTLFANASSADMYAAIDGLADKMDRQVRRLKGRLRDHDHSKPGHAASGL